MCKWIYPLFCLGLAAETRAMVQVRDLIEPTVRFYRSPSSQFSSGETSFTLLKDKQISTRLESWYWVDRGGAKEWIPSQNLFYLRDFYQQSPTEQSGILTATSSILRLKKDWRPDGTLKEGTELTITSVRSDWSCGRDKQGDVCVATNKLLLAIDAAQRVQTSNGKWHSVKYRIGHHMITENNQVVPVSKVKTWEANPNFAFIRPIGINGLRPPTTIDTQAPYERVLLLKKEIRRWNQSILGDHGNVWWQNIQTDSIHSALILLTREELVGRKIYDQTQHPKISLVSADGIFLSTDGESWKLLKQFGELNYPVTIGPRNTLVVGDQLSFDEGKTFQNYLRWDQVAMQAQKILRHPPKHLRLQSVKPMGHSSLNLAIDTGYKTLVFEFNTINSQIFFLQSTLKK